MIRKPAPWGNPRHSNVRHDRVSTAVHPSPFQSKGLGDGAKTGCIHPDFFNPSRLCTEGLLSTPVQTWPRRTAASLCTAAETVLVGKRRGRTGGFEAARWSPRPAISAGGATAHPRDTFVITGDHP
jgi:hypothetical protein